MSEDAGIEGGTDTSQGSAPVESSTGEATGGNPAWNEILSSLPDSLHSTVRPALEKWDNNYKSGIDKVHSEYEPYKQFKDNGYDAQTLNYALALMDKIDSDPRSIYDALAEHNGWTEQGLNDPEADENYDPSEETDPRLLRAEQMSEAVAEYVMQQHQQQEAAQEDAALDSEINSLRAQHNIAEDDENANQFVLGLMLAGASANEAFDKYIGMTGQIATRPRANDNAPVVMGAGSGLPSSQIPASQLRDPKSRKALLVQMLANAQANAE